MSKRVLTAAFLVALPLLQVVPAYATKGVDAIRACDARPDCKVIYDNSGGRVIVIVVDGTTIVCPSPQDDCSVWTKVGGTRLPRVNVDSVLVDPGRSTGSPRPAVTTAPGSLLTTR